MKKDAARERETTTRLWRVAPDAPEPEAIAEAARILRAGGLVAFPTETVYGLGANALDDRAVAEIFMAKGRPSTNPIIVHVPDIDTARTLVSDWPEAAQKLAEAFWPGPLTLVLPKAANIPDRVTAGGPTVGIRIPAHPVALALLQAAQVPIAAPSANRSEALSPVRAEHVRAGLDGRIELILDGGPISARFDGMLQDRPTGLESTVLSLAGAFPRLLRPGLISPGEIEAVIGPIARPVGKKAQSGVAASPGQMQRHYAPHARLELLPRARFWERVERAAVPGERLGVVYYQGVNSGARRPSLSNRPDILLQYLPGKPLPYAARLYATLHHLDLWGAKSILVMNPPRGDLWLAIRDRLTRAATPREE